MGLLAAIKGLVSRMFQSEMQDQFHVTGITSGQLNLQSLYVRKSHALLRLL